MELTARLEGLRQQRDAANAGLTESRVALAAEEQMCASFQQQRQSLEQRIRELTQVIEQRRGELSSFVGRKEQAESEIQESRGLIEKLQHDREQVNAQTAELVAQKQAQDAEVTVARGGPARAAPAPDRACRSSAAPSKSSWRRRTWPCRTCASGSSRSTTSTSTTFAASASPSPYADEGPAQGARDDARRKWPPPAPRRIGRPWPSRSRPCRQRIDEMGPVNLVAIEEYEETEQRYQFLSKQHDDLVQAKAQLLEVINRINVQTREMFRETFEKIRDSFRAMFTEVFGGGKADLVLMDENDLLESGIDIVARPPGKQLQTISLLSGGEQTMTAVALLFSIYQVKPSPFCVLDELDAPLDESNINRFIRVLQRFLAHSQFIIITHNKRTIGMADVLYGVTMQEHGVSKIVSVKFHKTDEAVTDHAAASLETPTTMPDVDAEEDAPQKRGETLEIVMAK